MAETTGGPAIDPRVSCHSCGTPIVDAGDRFCGICGAQLMRPDLRQSGAPTARPRRRPRAPAAPPGPARPAPVTIVQYAQPQAPERSSAAVVAGLATVVAVMLAAIAVTVIVLVSRAEDQAPVVTQPTTAVAAPTSTTP